jgi:hypothetical protein
MTRTGAWQDAGALGVSTARNGRSGHIIIPIAPLAGP